MISFYAMILAGSAFLFALCGTALLVWLLPRLNLLDHPEERKNHTVPTPRGGGIAVMFAALGFLAVAGVPGGVLLAAAALTLVSALDDHHSMPVRTRLLAQALAVLLVVPHAGGLVFQGVLPHWADTLLAGLALLWFTNLYNFMDGIDEITSMETAGIMLGLMLLVFAKRDLPNGLAVDAAVLGAAVLGFFVFNRHPAKIFLGDAGSIPLGLLTGFFLLRLAASGHWQAALILPAYYLSDATLTLLTRLLSGKKIWEAHSEHAYQRAVRAGRSHHGVAMNILWLNLVLTALAVASLLGGKMALGALALAYGLSLFLMARFFAAPPSSQASRNLPAPAHG
jgi:UDP-N-acetylmuramyl pentapeptide phosphotransferase/UDP-N-acetylglucosamine-1-phosphate transferase